ncbi:MAG: hypothetical protein QXU63_04420 [Nitrososphaerota archaeon]
MIYSVLTTIKVFISMPVLSMFSGKMLYDYEFYIDVNLGSG